MKNPTSQDKTPIHLNRLQKLFERHRISNHKKRRISACKTPKLDTNLSLNSHQTNSLERHHITPEPGQGGLNFLGACRLQGHEALGGAALAGRGVGVSCELQLIIGQAETLLHHHP